MSFTGLHAGDTLNYVGPDGKRQGHWIIYGRAQKDPAYAADAKVEEGRYNAGFKVGIWTVYFPTGSKKSEFTYVNNRPNGHAVTYNENGTKAEEGTWVGTRWSGDYHLYYEDGTERQAFNYNTLGQREGKQVYKNPNGTLAIEVTMKDGKEEGWKKEYDANGNLVRETYFNGGVIDDSKTINHKTGAPVATAPEDPKNDKTKEVPPAAPPQSNWNGEGQYTLMKGGQVSQKGVFHSYRLVNGEARFYDNNGFCIQVKKYENGKYVGDGPIPDDANK
ncbi:MAG: toxin-antitoxin system YwqK family antitoxin [Bacteroidetes bacterium]|nr:toxin-antitoxin system YwqK family antitoxin [Bacteroidota bacterium]